MPAFLQIGQKVIAPAHILSIVPGVSFSMNDGTEIARAKVTVTFTNHTETFYDADAVALRAWLTPYIEFIDAAEYA
jgi:hypothetical protein